MAFDELGDLGLEVGGGWGGLEVGGGGWGVVEGEVVGGGGLGGSVGEVVAALLGCLLQRVG